MRHVKDPEKRLLLAAKHVIEYERPYPLPDDRGVALSVLTEVWVCVGKEHLAELKAALAYYKAAKEASS